MAQVKGMPESCPVVVRETGLLLGLAVQKSDLGRLWVSVVLGCLKVTC